MTAYDGPSIGRRIEALRKLNGWSRDVLAERTGERVRRDVIANIEGGRKKELTVPQLVYLAEALSVPPLALLVDLNDLRGPSQVELISADGDLQNLTNYGFIQWFAGTLPLDEVGDEDELLPSQVYSSKILNAIHDLATRESDYAASLVAYAARSNASKTEEAALLERVSSASDARVEARRRLTSLGVKVDASS